MPRVGQFGGPNAPARGPGGRPKLNKEVQELAREHTGLAIATLVEICKSKKQNGSARVSAANILLCRGWGNPSQHVDLSGGVNVKTLDDASLDKALRVELAAFLIGETEGNGGEGDSPITH